jgi:hypothetical protein
VNRPQLSRSGPRSTGHSSGGAANVMRSYRPFGLSLPFVAVPPPGASVFLTAQSRRRVCQPE